MAKKNLGQLAPAPKKNKTSSRHLLSIPRPHHHLSVLVCNKPDWSRFCSSDGHGKPGIRASRKAICLVRSRFFPDLSEMYPSWKCHGLRFLFRLGRMSRNIVRLVLMVSRASLLSSWLCLPGRSRCNAMQSLFADVLPFPCPYPPHCTLAAMSPQPPPPSRRSRQMSAAMPTRAAWALVAFARAMPLRLQPKRNLCADVVLVEDALAAVIGSLWSNVVVVSPPTDADGLMRKCPGAKPDVRIPEKNRSITVIQTTREKKKKKKKKKQTWL